MSSVTDIILDLYTNSKPGTSFEDVLEPLLVALEKHNTSLLDNMRQEKMRYEQRICEISALKKEQDLQLTLLRLKLAQAQPENKEIAPFSFGSAPEKELVPFSFGSAPVPFSFGSAPVREKEPVPFSFVSAPVKKEMEPVPFSFVSAPVKEKIPDPVPFSFYVSPIPSCVYSYRSRHNYGTICGKPGREYCSRHAQYSPECIRKKRDFYKDIEVFKSEDDDDATSNPHSKKPRK